MDLGSRCSLPKSAILAGLTGVSMRFGRVSATIRFVSHIQTDAEYSQRDDLGLKRLSRGSARSIIIAKRRWRVCLSPWARQQLVAFRDRLMPPAKTVAGRFPTPSGSRWSDVEMRFSDTEKISVTIRNQRQVLTYSQLGLVDSRSGRPANSGNFF